MSYSKLTRDQIAERVAQDIPDGAYVNLVSACQPKFPATCQAIKMSFCILKMACWLSVLLLLKKTAILS